MATIPEGASPGLVRISYGTSDGFYIPNSILDRNRDRILTNIEMLFARTKGTLFRTDGQGRLVEITTWSEWFSYKWNLWNPFRKIDERKRVKHVIDEALEVLNQFFSDMQDQKVATAAIKYLFNQTGNQGIGRLGKALYNHKLFLTGDNALSRHAIPSHTIRIQCGKDTRFSGFVDVVSKEEMAEGQLITLDLRNKKDNHNLRMLLKRKKGEIYQVDDKGFLRKVSLSQRAWYITDRTSHEKRVQQVVHATVSRLSDYLSKKNIIAVHKFVIKQIFSPQSPLCRLNRNLFYRGIIKEGSVLESLIDPEMKKKRKALQTALAAFQGSDPDEAKELKLGIETAFMDLVYQEFLFAQKLGLDLERIGSGGSGGARFARDRYGKKILVIKPEDEGPTGVNNPKWYARIKRLLISPKVCLEGNSEPIAELESWRCDRKFDIWCVPPTAIIDVESDDFVGRHHKKCSVQMFVENCTTLDKHLGIPSFLSSLPRHFLRWFFGSKHDTGIFDAWGQRIDMKEWILERLPLLALILTAIHNFLIEDIDCHFENILVQLTPVTKNGVFERLFAYEEVTDSKIGGICTDFFKKGNHQKLLANLLFSEQIEIDGEKHKISLIKHDGGASSPHSHPSTWDFLSLRNKHLFEVLPHFEELANKYKYVIEGREEDFKHYLIEKTEYALKAVLDSYEMESAPDAPPSFRIFDAFWLTQANRRRLWAWIFAPASGDSYDAGRRQKDMIATLRNIVETQNIKVGSDFPEYLEHHFTRIKDNLNTRIDSFRMVRAYLATNNVHFLRAPFTEVQSRGQFRNKLQGLEDGFDELMARWCSDLNNPLNQVL